MSWVKAAALAGVLGLGCLPVATSLQGKACEATAQCGPDLVCLNAVCVVADGTSPPISSGGDAQVSMPSSPNDAGTGAGDGGSPGPACDAGTQTEICTDGIDNDCDSLIDCADPSCLRQHCSTSNTASVCCGGTGGAACIDVSTDPLHCGSCGAACGAGRACTTIAIGNVRSGQCGCGVVADCPKPGGINEDPVCAAGRCQCAQVSECGPSQACTIQAGDTTGVCHY
jgi:hypothetical protein